MEDGRHTTQVIREDGTLVDDLLQAFAGGTWLAGRQHSYAVVSIMGPQSSGKSTLLNHLFGTQFEEMDPVGRRRQTTRGIWLAKAFNIEPFTIVMDVEGSDGRERGEDDTSFEKKSATFALTVSDVVLVNMWCHDVGREQAGSKPLLRTVFQAMVQLVPPQMTKLIFVLRDKTKTPLFYLQDDLREDIHQIWNSIRMPEGRENAVFSDYFDMDVRVLPSYETQMKEFQEEVERLRDDISMFLVQRDLPGDGRGVPGSLFPDCVKQFWSYIRQNNDFEVPSYRKLLSIVRCEEIRKQKLHLLVNDELLRELKNDAKSNCRQDLGEALHSILSRYLSQYDADSLRFDEDIKLQNHLQLRVDALQVMEPIIQAVLGPLCAEILQNFKSDISSFLGSVNNILKSETAIARCIRLCLLDFDNRCNGSGLASDGPATYQHVWFVETNATARERLKSEGPYSGAYGRGGSSVPRRCVVVAAGGASGWWTRARRVAVQRQAAAARLLWGRHVALYDGAQQRAGDLACDTRPVGLRLMIEGSAFDFSPTRERLIKDFENQTTWTWRYELVKRGVNHTLAAAVSVVTTAATVVVVFLE